MGPGFISPEGCRARVASPYCDIASMGPGFISPEGLGLAACIFTSDGSFNGAGLHQPGRHDSVQNITSYAFVVLQWGRASSARKALHVQCIRNADTNFNGAGLHQPGRPVCSISAAAATILQWGRASSARKATCTKDASSPRLHFNGAGLHQPGRHLHANWDLGRFDTSMGPGFISPEGAPERLKARDRSRLQWGRASSARKAYERNMVIYDSDETSMGPGFISPEGMKYSDSQEDDSLLQWGRASSARKALPITKQLGEAIGLQWGRASSARKANSPPCQRP